MTVRDPDFYSFRLRATKYFSVENITFDHLGLRTNQDGVNVSDCEDGAIRNLRALHPLTVTDDMVALNSMNVGPVRNVHVEGLRAERVGTFVRILSESQPAENITIRDISGGCQVNAINMNNWRFPIGCGHIRNVDIRGIRVNKVVDERGVHSYPQYALVKINLNVRNLVIERLERPEDGEAAPTLEIENQLDNTVRLALRSREQMERLDNDSALPGSAVLQLQMPDGDVLHQADLQMSADHKLVLARGGFERLELNPED